MSPLLIIGLAFMACWSCGAGLTGSWWPKDYQRPILEWNPDMTPEEWKNLQERPL